MTSQNAPDDWIDLSRRLQRSNLVSKQEPQQSAYLGHRQRSRESVEKLSSDNSTTDSPKRHMTVLEFNDKRYDWQ